MDQLGNSRRTLRQTWLLALGLVAVLFVAGMPVVQAQVSTVKVKGKVGVKGTVKVNVANKPMVRDTRGNVIESKNVPDMGLLSAPGSDGALAVRTFAGGTGFLGTAQCATTSPRGQTVTVPASQNTIITGIIITGTDAKVAVTAPDLAPTIGPFPVANFRTTAGNPNVFVGLGNGLTVFPSELVFKCEGSGGPDGSGEFVILGQ